MAIKRTGLRVGVLMTGLGLLSACAPKVKRFEVVPSHVCSGTPVTLHMEVVGKPTLTTSPILAQGPGNTYAPTETTHFVLSVRRWPTKKPAGSETEVKVMPGTPPEPDEITASVTCREGVLLGTLERATIDWDPRLVVGIVTSGEERDVEIAHAGLSARLTANNPTTGAFDGVSPAGDWRLSSFLKPGETCEAIASTALLNVSADVRCKD